MVGKSITNGFRRLVFHQIKRVYVLIENRPCSEYMGSCYVHPKGTLWKTYMPKSPLSGCSLQFRFCQTRQLLQWGYILEAKLQSFVACRSTSTSLAPRSGEHGDQRKSLRLNCAALTRFRCFFTAFLRFCRFTECRGKLLQTISKSQGHTPG